ncbi:RNA-binding cell elongation regulator Jag/EloR [Fredinandcohnia sp. QZ13]|uniref:RNA-binding cell elongation regulator Jag/EloR n=1 Tax=Fredinandcohnia sp. QZ13 TaxID=3073144 RepID=UPI0028531F0D|nr:RNA-binding cell elongation regulator Jag/EloR [Fredinandcohnia sp. QZ13]MDR4890495.1 RNA-binding cell elongation regulator Jag/EloR [Fredinandcohnia sp. QZ13]
MKQVTATGQTVDEAVESALAQLSTTRDRTEIQIIDEGKKGIFGIFGTKPAVVKVTVKIDPVEEAQKFLEKVISSMGVQAKLDVFRNGKNVTFQLSGEKMAVLIGKRGQTLNSLQYLTQLVANRFSDHYLNIMVDAENYRGRREETLVQLAERLADKVSRTKQDVKLEPMPSYERKVIHTALANHAKVKTSSSGSDPNRYIVISPVK